MDDTRKTEVEDIISTRDVLKKWVDYYIKNNFGIGIQCDKCKKWRQIYQYKDASEVPKVWICSMWKIDDIRRGSCRMPSNLNEDDFVDAQYSPGSLVWAKLDGHPKWPAMIEDCPDTQQYFMSYANSEHEYHVNFFGNKPLRSWIKASHIQDFTKPPPTTPKAKKNRYLQRSIEQANDALKMSVKERLKKYSFVVRYKGPWAKVKELDKVDLPPSYLKQRRKEKSTDSRSQVIAKDRTSAVRKVRQVKSNSEKKSADNEDSQQSSSYEEKMEQNKHSKSLFSVLNEAGAKETQQPSGKCIQQSVKPKRCRLSREKHHKNPTFIHEESSKNSSINECQIAHLIEASNQTLPIQGAKNFSKILNILESDESNNSLDHHLYTEKRKLKEGNKESSVLEDLLVRNFIATSSDEDESIANLDLNGYSQFLSTNYPTIFKDMELLSDNETSNSSNGETSSSIRDENAANFSENDSIISHQNAANFSENDSIISHENASEFSENDLNIIDENSTACSLNGSDSYILARDPSLLRTPYPSCSAAENN